MTGKTSVKPTGGVTDPNALAYEHDSLLESEAVLKNPTRSTIASIGGLARSARHDPAELARTGQQGLLNRFIREVDRLTPDLPEPERQRRAEALRRAHMRRLSLKSAAARKKGAAA